MPITPGSSTLYHLNANGRAGFVLSKGSPDEQQQRRRRIRKALVDAGLIDCIVNLPTR